MGLLVRCTDLVSLAEDWLWGGRAALRRLEGRVGDKKKFGRILSEPQDIAIVAVGSLRCDRSLAGYRDWIYVYNTFISYPLRGSIANAPPLQGNGGNGF